MVKSFLRKHKTNSLQIKVSWHRLLSIFSVSKQTNKNTPPCSSALTPRWGKQFCSEEGSQPPCQPLSYEKRMWQDVDEGPPWRHLQLLCPAVLRLCQAVMNLWNSTRLARHPVTLSPNSLPRKKQAAQTPNPPRPPTPFPLPPSRTRRRCHCLPANEQKTP